MKNVIFPASIACFLGTVLAHGNQSGAHHQEENLLGSTDPLLLSVTLGMILLGLILMAVSVRKYRKDS